MGTGGGAGIHSSQHNYQLDIKKEKRKKEECQKEAKAGSAGRREEERRGRARSREGVVEASCMHHWAEGFHPQPSTCTTD